MIKQTVRAVELQVGDWFQVHSSGSIMQLAGREVTRDAQTGAQQVRLTDGHGNVCFKLVNALVTRHGKEN